MSVEFKLPALGEDIESGDIINVLVREGDQITANQAVFELETDKAVLELPCPQAGKVAKIHAAKGDTVNVGQTLLTIEPVGPAEEGPVGPAEEEPVGPAEEEPVGPAGEEPVGPAVPAAEEQPPGARGGSPAAAEEHPKPAAATEQPSPAGAPCPLPAGPATRRLARELGIDLTDLTGSGPHGRITPDDVRAAVGSAVPAAATPAVQGATGSLPASAEPEPLPMPPPGEPGRDAWGPIRRDRISKIRRTIAEKMVLSASTIPHVTNFDDADVTELEHLRKGVPPGYLGEGLKLTAMPFVLKAVAWALRQHPMLNASLDEENQQIVYKEYVHVGVAVDTPRGLVVPALRNVDRMPIAQIVRELKTLAERARAAAFAIEDLRGGTFTVSNLGAVGGSYSTPIINHPEVAILLLGRSRWMPVVRQDKIETRLMMPLSLSFDHRLVDGAAAGRFLGDVIDLLQSPGKVLLA